MKHVCRLAAPNKCRERQQGVLAMPQYSSLTDGEIARLATDLRRTRTKLPPWSDLAPRVGGIAMKKGRTELCDRDNIQPQWSHRFGAQS